jgi:hypothetical protein
VGALIKRRGTLGAEARDLVDLSCCWTVAGLVFFSVSTRLEHYAFAFLPPLALLLGLALSRYCETEGSVECVWVERGMTLLALGGVVLGVALWVATERLAEAFLFSPGRSLSSDTYDFGPLFHLPARVAPALLSLARLAGFTLILAGGCLLLLQKAERRRSMILAVFSLATIFCGLSAQALKACEPALSSNEFGTAVSDVYKPGDRVVSLGDFETANSLLVYTRAPLLVLDGKASVLEWGLGFEDAPVRVLDKAAFEALWMGPSRIFLLAPPEGVPPLGLPHYSEVLRSAGRVLLCNQEVGRR